MTGMPGYPCPVCRRAGGAVTIQMGREGGGVMAQLCSPECAKVWIMRGEATKDNERLASTRGGEAAGAYLEGIGKTDLAALTVQEWDRFCETLFRETCGEMARLADDGIPF